MTFSLSHKMRIAVGVSGGGRSLLNLIEKQKTQPFEIAFVFSSSPDAGANQIARNLGIPLLIENFAVKNQAVAKNSLYEALRDFKIDLVVLAGFLKLLPVDPSWARKIINIHPALLPKFGGKGMHGHQVHAAVIAAQEATSGASIHFVNERYDEGALIAQSRVPVNSNDTADILAARVFASECDLLPWTITQIAKGRLPAATSVVFNPLEEES